MNIHRALPFVVVALAPCLAIAQGVHKCRDAQGHVQYSQSPCQDVPQEPAGPAAPAETPATPERTEKVSPRQRAQDARGPQADPDAGKPLVDSMGRPDVTRMSGTK